MRRSVPRTDELLNGPIAARSNVGFRRRRGPAGCFGIRSLVRRGTTDSGFKRGRMTPNPSGAEVAHRLLEREARALGAPGDLVSAAESVFRRLHEHLSRWFGFEGYDALVARTIDRARVAHPVLGSTIAVPPEEANGKGREHARLAAIAASLRALPDEEADATLVSLLGTFISLLGRLVGDEMALQMIVQSFPDDGKRDPRPNR